MAFPLPNTTEVQITRLCKALYDAAPGNLYLTSFTSYAETAGVGMDQVANELAAFVSADAATLAATVVASLDITGDLAVTATAWLTGQLEAQPGKHGEVILDTLNALSGMTSDPTWGAVATAYNDSVATSYAYSINTANNSVNMNVLQAADEPAPAETGQTFTLTTSADTGASFTGSGGNDTFVGTLTFASDAIASTATLTPGDGLTGGAGTDTLNITVTGSAVDNAGYTSTPTLAGFEKVLVANFETDAAADDNVTIDLSLADTALTTIGTSSSTAVGTDTNFANVGQIAAVEMAGKGGLSVGFTSAAVEGTADSLTVTANGVGTSAAALSTLTFNGIETANIASATSANYLSVDGDANLKTVNVSGAKNMVVDVETTVTKVDASTATGNVTVVADGLTLADVTLTGGSGADTLSFDNDITVTSSSSDLKNVTGFETIAITADTKTVSLSADVSGLTTIDISDTDIQTVTLGTGYTQAVTVNMKGNAGANDVINNTANIALTVNAKDTDIDNGVDLNGGTGTDTLNITANGGTLELDQVTGFETITILAGTLGTEDVTADVNNADNTVASAKTLTIDAAALTNSGARLVFTGAGELDGYFNITGGAGNDNITGGSAADTISGGAHNDTIDGGAGNDVIDGGAGNDSITAGTGNDSLVGGAGNDTFDLAGNLASADTIDGGDGTDTLKVTSVSSSALTNVTNVENLAITGANSVSLTANLGFTTFDLSDASNQVLTLGTGYTNATAVTLEAGDSVTNSANVALDVTAAAIADVTTGTTITGGTGTDTLTVYADGVGATLTSVAGVETITVLANKTTASTTASLITVTGNVLADKTLTVDATALTNSSATFTFNGSAETSTVGNFKVTSGAGDDVLTGGSGNDIIDGGAGNDGITAGAGNDSLIGGAGNDTFTMSTNITYEDTVAGGDGTDVLTTSGTRTDVDFMNVSGVETLTASAAAAFTLATFATAAGITKVNTFDTANNSISAVGMSGGVTFVISDDAGAGDSVTGGTGNDTFVFEDNDLDAQDAINGTSGTDTIRLDNDNGTDGTGNAVSVVLDVISNIDSVTVNDLATDNAAGDVSITMANGTYDQTSLAVDASALDAGETLTFNAIATTMTDTDEAFSVTGGAGNDTITGGAGNDTVIGGDGDDLITGDDRADNLTGGAGNDTFAYASGDSAGTNVDTITDFEAGGDKLKISLSLASGNLDVTDKGNATSNADGLSLLSSVAGQYFFNTGNAQFVADLDGNGLIQATDMVITMTGETGLADSDVRVFVTATAADNANIITTGGGDDVVSGNNGIDTITTGGGNDYLQGSAAGDGSDADVMIGGAGNDTYAFLTASASDNLITETSGTDTIYVGASISLVNLELGADNTGGAGTDLYGATDALKIEQIVILSGETATFAGSQLTGNAITVAESGTGTTGLVVTATATGTTNLSSLVFTTTGVTYVDSNGNSASVTALTSGTDTIVINGADGSAEVIVGTSYAQTIDAGTGADDVTLGAAADIYAYTAGDSGANWATADIIRSFSSAADGMNFSTAAGTGANYAEADGTAMADEAAVLAAARVALDGTVLYYFAYNVNGSGDGYLYYDADGVDTGEQVIKLVGASTAGFLAETDIV